MVQPIRRGISATNIWIAATNSWMVQPIRGGIAATNSWMVQPIRGGIAATNSWMVQPIRGGIAATNSWRCNQYAGGSLLLIHGCCNQYVDGSLHHYTDGFLLLIHRWISANSTDESLVHVWIFELAEHPAIASHGFVQEEAEINTCACLLSVGGLLRIYFYELGIVQQV